MKYIRKLFFAFSVFLSVLLFMGSTKAEASSLIDDLVRIDFSSSGMDDAFDQHSFKDLGVTSNQSALTLDSTSVSDGLLISGKNAQMKASLFTLGSTFDFGSHTVDRIEIDALAKKSTKTKLSIYLDQDTEPITSVSLYCQAKEDDWTRVKPIVLDLSDLQISGSHVIHFMVEDQTTDDSKKSSLLLRSMKFIQSSIPVLYFNIDESMGSIAAMNSDSTHKTACYGNLTIKVPSGYSSEYDEGSDPYTGGSYDLDYIRGRGNTSWSLFDKKPYKIKLDEKADLFHMGSNKHWVLLSTGFDPSLLHNRMTYNLASRMGLASVDNLYVDVYMNGEPYGTYLLCEQVRVGKSRVDIDDLSDHYDESSLSDLELTGGYLLGMENNSQSEEYSFTTSYKENFTVVSPGEDGSVSYKKANQYIQNHMQRIENAIYHIPNEDGVIENVWDLMDLDSTVKYYLLMEFANNYDAYATSSTYLYKARDVRNSDGSITESKVYWGPVWDFDLAYYKRINDTEYKEFDVNDGWLNQLRQNDPIFLQALKEYWPSFRSLIMDMVAEDGNIDSYAQEISSSIIHNYMKYPLLICDAFEEFSMDSDDESSEEDTITENSQTTEPLYSIKEYYSLLVQAQKDWISNRVTWIDQNMDSIKIPTVTITYMSEGKVYHVAKEGLGRSMIHYPTTNPKSSDGNKVFVGWTYETKDSTDDETIINSFDADSCVEASDLVATEDGYALTVTARFENISSLVYPSNVFFERTSYYLLYEDASTSTEDSCDNSVLIRYDLYPENITQDQLTWSIDHQDVFYIAGTDDGVMVKFKSYGDATLTCTTENGKKFQCQIHVLNPETYSTEEYDFSDLNLSQSSLTLTLGSYKKLNVTTDPEKAFLGGKTALAGLQWKSDNEEVASVGPSGLVIAKSIGTANIIVRDRSHDIIRTCKITVKAKAKSAKLGDVFTSGKIKYKVTKLGKNGTVKVIGEGKNYETITIPATVKYLNNSYKVNRIEAKAFYKKSKLKTLTIGKNVSSIGSKAFYKASKLKKITIQTSKLKKSTVGSKAFKHLHKKAVVKVPKSKKKYYKSLLKKKGLTGSKQKVKY